MSTAPQPNFALASFSMSSNYEYDPLLSDGQNVVSKRGMLTAGIGFVKRGTLLSVNVTTGVVILADAAANTPNAVMAENCDSTAAAAPCIFYVSGKMKYDAIIFPATGSRGAMIDKLRDYGILIESVLDRNGVIGSAVMPVTLTPATAAPTNAGGATTFAVAKDNAGDTGTWMVTKDASATWITITAPTVPQTANGNVSYTVAANAAGQPARTANMYVNGQTFKVTQAAGA